MSNPLDPTLSNDRSVVRAGPGQPVWVVLNHVKADQRANFERFVHEILNRMAETKAPDQARQLRVLHPTTANDDGTYTYVFLMDPLVVGGDYSFDQLTPFYGEEKASEYLHLWEDALARPQVGYEVVHSSW